MGPTRLLIKFSACLKMLKCNDQTGSRCSHASLETLLSRRTSQRFGMSLIPNSMTDSTTSHTSHSNCCRSSHHPTTMPHPRQWLLVVLLDIVLQVEPLRRPPLPALSGRIRRGSMLHHRPPPRSSPQTCQRCSTNQVPYWMRWSEVSRMASSATNVAVQLEASTAALLFTQKPLVCLYGRWANMAASSDGLAWK